ncbi:cryptochrome/photolyase family protein [Frigidibacter oleivorans]|uniref:cryptochrome/photolyase family protein n=1 Tax=Frigidibacter oleivorans TaxID=2487129 RepID=UPI000F8C5B56|nr:deoxyribodipyrimidine photo-lyase [Frigidibacter oleivorans]
MSPAPLILWFRRDLRLGDLPALDAAVASGRPVIPVFLLDEVAEAYGAAPKWRLAEAVAHHGDRLAGKGSRLILRRGRALDGLQALIAETGAEAVFWTRLYDPASRKRDEDVKAALKARGIEARSFPGHVLFEPWEVETGEGSFYKVYSPFWRAVRGREVRPPLRAPARLPVPDRWPGSDRLEDWAMGAAMRRGAAVVAKHARVGEDRARDRLHDFLDRKVAEYRQGRDYPARDVTSGLSENLAWGEISPGTIWHAARAAMDRAGLAEGAEHFLKELVWRDFAWHLLHHTPHIADRNWREDWDAFPWRRDNAQAERWRRGMTGERFVDAAMREMFVTGTMHNRARMVVASYLTKHLLTDWRVGLRWFEDCLTDWDPASNALNWQWVAGSGPDAAPYFRVFNPAGQAEKFDGAGQYLNRWIAEGQARPPGTALDFFRACPVSWGLDPAQDYPDPAIDLREGRERALAAYRRG